MLFVNILLLRPCRAIAAENSKKPVQRTVLGIVQPGDTVPVPYGWQKAGVPMGLHVADWQNCCRSAEFALNVHWGQLCI